MHALRAALCLFVLAAPQLAPAVQHLDPGTPARAGLPEPDVIERGGTIDGVDANRHTILVDGSPYAVVPGLRIHLAGGRTSGSLWELRRGMQIRFTSAKGPRAAQVREIWVTGMRKP